MAIAESNSSGRALWLDPVRLGRLVWSDRWPVLILSVTIAVLAAVASLFVPAEYRSSTTILPETDRSKLGSLSGGLSDLAALAGVSVGGEAAMTKLYPAIVESESVLREVLYRRYHVGDDSLTLVQVLDIDETSPAREFEEALKAFRKELSLSVDSKTGLVTISAILPDALLTAQVVNGLARELDVFLRTKKSSGASEQRKWIESRLNDVERDLRLSEEAVKIFREKNRRVIDSPQLLLEQERLLRDVQINSTLYIELKKQLEIARIEEIKNIPVISVLDPARPAARKERPRRSIITMVAGLMGLLAASLWSVAEHQRGQTLRGRFTQWRVPGRRPTSS